MTDEGDGLPPLRPKLRKKGDLQFQAYDDYSGSYHGYALNTGGNPVAHVTISNDEISLDDDPWWDEADKVSWAMANKEGRTRAGPHMLLAMMKSHFGLEPTADEHLTHEGAMMSRSAAKRGLIKPHPNNPSMRTSIDYLGSAANENSIKSTMSASYSDALSEADDRMVHFNTGARNEARAQLFPRMKQRKQKEDPQGKLF